jgi:hypothetical protein
LFAIIHWHHLVATAISLALLGYGASGTFLAIAGKRLQTAFAPAFIGNALLFGLSSLVCVNLAQGFPFDPQALTWDWYQLGYLAGGFLILALPFFAAANCIGLSLWYFKSDIPRIYGVDLIGAGLGATGLLGGLILLAPENILFGIFLIGTSVAILAAFRLAWHPWTVALAAIALSALVWLWGRPALQPAQYKDLTRSLAVVGADLVYQQTGIAGVLSVVRNERVPIREAPGLSLHAEASPPDQLAVFIDGDATGTLDVGAAGKPDAAYLRYLTSALPYALLQAPEVAVLNAATGLGVELALRSGAKGVVAVEPNPQLRELVCEDEVQSGHPRCGPGVDWLALTPRSFAAGNDRVFDLITLGIHADPAGLDALNSDYDFTREAVAGYLGRLSHGGILAIDGPTRVPPRLSMRAIDTARAALEQLGIDAAGKHIAAIRGWQHFVLLVSNEPVDQEPAAAVRAFADARGFDLIWLPQMDPAEANRYQQLARPLFHEQAARILDVHEKPLTGATRFKLAAATDDIPFPHRFTQWTEWRSSILSGQRQRLSQLDTGFFVATAILVVVAVGGLLLIVIPLFWLQRQNRSGPAKGQRIRTLLYFGLVGIGFLFIEMAWIQRLQLFLGLPIYATAIVLIAFLVFAGLGSLWSQKLSAAQTKPVLIAAVAMILLASVAYLSFVPALLDHLAEMTLAGRGAIILMLLAPLAFAMGIPFPSGLRRLGSSSSDLIPWAWGINGVTSVISAAAAPLLAMEIGFSGLTTLAVAAYLLLPAIPLDQRAPAQGSGTAARY